jgi:hypothetical protein
LIEKGAEVESKEFQFGFTPLHAAAWHGYEGMVQLLLGKADLNAMTIAGHTALSLAELRNYETIARLLKRASGVRPDMLDSSDESDRESVASSILSNESTTSSQSSVSSLNSIHRPALQTAVDELEALLANDEVLKPLCIAAFNSESIGAERFERNFHRLIKEFSRGLRKEANTALEKSAGHLVGRRAKQIAYDIRMMYSPEANDNKAKQMLELKYQKPQRAKQIALERAIYQQKTNEAGHTAIDDLPLSTPHDAIVDSEDQSSEDQSSEEDDLGDRDDEEIPTISNVRKFLVSSYAFSNLQHSFHRFVYPDILKAIRKEMVSVLESSGRQTVDFHVQWNLEEYYDKELSGNPVLTTLLTVTGTAKAAYATTCEEYVSRYWPESGLGLLKSLQTALIPGKYGELRL